MFAASFPPLACIDELIAEPTNYGKISFPLPPEALPASILLATQRSRAGLSGVRHLWDGLRVRLDNNAAGAQADNIVIWLGIQRRVEVKWNRQMPIPIPRLPSPEADDIVLPHGRWSTQARVLA